MCFEEFLEEIDDYKPFGKGFEKPRGLLRFRTSDVVSWETMSKGVHMKIVLPGGFEVLCWNQGHLINQKDLFTDHSVMGSLDISEYGGTTSIVFKGDFVEQ